MKMKLLSTLGKILFLVCLPLLLNASVNASLDKIAIYKGDRVTLSIKASGDDIEFPNIKDIAGYNIIGTSISRQMYIVNAKVTKSEVMKYTFAPSASVTIPSFSIKVDGKIEKTKELKVKIVKLQASKIGDDFIFEFHLSKDKVYVGEAVRATFKFSYKVGINPLDVNLEEFKPKHFWVKELSNPKPKEENGYITQSINYLIFPQNAGKQLLDNQIINVATRQRKTNFIIWKKVLSNEKELEVLALPENLNVQGSYILNVTVDKTKIKANEPVNLSIKVEGFGNIDDIEGFKLLLDDEVVYASKPQIQATIKDGKYGGVFTQKISIIADKDFTIPALKFKYFDIKSKKVKTISSDTFNIKVQSKTKDTPVIQTKNNIKTIQLPPKIIIQKEDEEVKYIYALLGIFIGMILMYLIKRDKKTKHIELEISKQIKKAKGDKALYEVLLPYSSNLKLKPFMKEIEENLYNNTKHKINKKSIIEVFEEEII
ncbi:MAG TPA: hypothetical protein EYG73_06920 [Arcobacter sp.]|nr:hypothetical protein [Arcobacter sp.]